MSPLPNAARWREYGTKATEFVLRQVAQAPEQRQARLLRDQSTPADGSPRILVVSPRDWAAHVQYEAMIGHALRLRGAHVEFLTCGGGLEICDRSNTYEAPPMPCTTCTRYVEASLDAHGFARRTIRAGWEADDPGVWPEIDAVPSSILVDVEQDGLALGRLVDVALKWFLCAAAVEGEPLAGMTARAFLRSARRIVRGVAEALDEIRPDTVLLLNGLFLFEALVWALCRERGIDVVTYERAFLKETLVFRRDTPAGFYDFSAEWPAENRPLAPGEGDELDRYLADRRRGGAFDQFWTFSEGAESVSGSGRLVVVFTNLTWDTAVIGRDIAFPDIRAWLDTIIDAFAARPDDRVVIRIHPSEVHLPGKRTRDSLEEYIRQAHPDLPPNVLVVGALDPTSSYALIEGCDLGLVYTSTTGLELALAGKPVIVCGDVHYRGKGFTIDVSGAAEMLDAVDRGLERPDALPTDVETARRYAHYFWFRAPVGSPMVSEPLPGLARLDTTDLHDLAPGVNDNVDRICDFILARPGVEASTASRKATT